MQKGRDKISNMTTAKERLGWGMTRESKREFRVFTNEILSYMNFHRTVNYEVLLKF